MGGNTEREEWGGGERGLLLKSQSVRHYTLNACTCSHDGHWRHPGLSRTKPVRNVHRTLNSSVKEQQVSELISCDRSDLTTPLVSQSADDLVSSHPPLLTKAKDSRERGRAYPPPSCQPRTVPDTVCSPLQLTAAALTTRQSDHPEMLGYMKYIKKLISPLFFYCFNMATKN